MSIYTDRISLNWKVVIMSLFVNFVTILLTIILVPGIRVLDEQLKVVVLVAVTLAILNAVIKPILQLLTIRLLFISYGLVLVLINVLLLLLIELIFSPNLVIDSIFAAFLGAILIGLIGGFLDYLFGVVPPLPYEWVEEETT